MPYNFLRDARIIENSFLCVHDTLDAYSSDFHINGDVDNWDIYNNIYLYGCWNGTLFGTANDRSCYISRNNVFSVVEAEDYYYIKILMKVTNNNPDKVVGGLTTGRIQWLRLGEAVWDSTKQIDFDLVVDDKWRLYSINMGPAPEWQGNINNLRVYPFIDGWSGDHFAIKFIKISSLSKFACDNTQCSYFPFYEHNCPGAGIRGSCVAGTSSSFYTTVSGVSDELAVDIDGYGYEYFNLGDNENATGIDIAKIIANKISTFNIGGYSYSSCEYSELNKLKITSGTVGTTSAVGITGSAAKSLGFEDSEENDISTKVTGTNPATGFDYASSRFLSAYEISKLIDGDTDNFAYMHDPTQYSVEGGRRDFNEVGTYRLISSLAAGEYYDSLNNVGKTIIDYSHPIDNNGKLKAVYMYGKVDSASRIKILRPRSDGQLLTVYSLSLPTENASYLYTSRPLVYRVDCDILVNKGDLIGIYNADLYVGVSKTGLPDATFCQINGEATGIFDPGVPFSYGLAGLSIYARGDRWQTNTILDIDLGDRINVEEINIYGSEDASYFEFNVASCLDVSWEVDLFSQSHYHTGINWITIVGFTDIHTNTYYGRDALDDSIRTADNGQVGTSYGSDSSGLYTTGDNHSYFYVNGDAEWLYNYTCTGKTEYCWPNVPRGIGGFKYDPIAFILKFPNEKSAPIHKSIVYFKERNNFRSMALSYYLGRYEFTGNADDTKFRLIPSYNSVKLDGIEYLPGDNDYIFNNPTSARVRYASGNKDPINWEEYSASIGTDWTIIEHNFDEIESLGFRIYTNHHNSTKISEIELYSKMKTTPSLLDNVTLSFSDYGEIWVSPSFNELTSGKIQAFLGGAPRYITMEFDASTEFSINEIELLVGDQVKTGDCSDIVLLDHAKSGAVNEATPITLENVYDKPFDLTVDLPRQTYEVDNLVFWSKMGSYDEIEKPEIGPGCKLFKSDDHNIRNDNSQCAINTPSYALKNILSNSKNAYYNEDDEHWQSYGTISSGVSLDFCNNSYRKTEFTFNSVSSEYWKIGFPLIIDYVDAFNVDPNWTISNTGSYSYGGGWDSINKRFSFTVYKDNAGYQLAYKTFNSTISEADSLEIKFKFRATSNSGLAGVSIGLTNIPIVKAGLRLSFYLNSTGWNSIELKVTNMNGSISDLVAIVNPGPYWQMNTDYYVKVTSNGSGSYAMFIWTDTWDGASLFGTRSMSSSIAWDSTKFGIVHANHGSQGNSISGWIDDVDIKSPLMSVEARYIDAYYNDTLVEIEKVYFDSSNDNMAQSSGVVSDGVDMNPGPGISGYNTAIGFKLTGLDPVNKIRIIHQNHLSEFFNSANVYVNSVNDNNYILWDDESGNLSFNYSNSTYNTYFVIDLSNRYDIDVIRNYGSATNKLLLSDSNMDYSNSEVSSPYNVTWDNSTRSDLRWLRVNILTGDETTRCLRKLGIYPEIETVFGPAGGYNCEWQSLGNILSDYNPPINVAYDATVTGTNYYFLDYYPENAVNGVNNDYRAQACWGFQEVDSVDPYMRIDFDQTYTINKVVLYHGYDPADSGVMNTNYTFSTAYSVYDPGHEVTPSVRYSSSTGVFGDSMYFDGSTTYLTIDDSDDWDFRSNHYAIDFRVKFSSFNTADGFDTFLWFGADVDPNVAFQVDYKNSTNKLRYVPYRASTPNVIEQDWTPSLNTWYHVAVTSFSGTVRLFVDGQQIGTTTSGVGSNTPLEYPLYIGAKGTTFDRNFNGYMDELRISKGDSRWTSNFTPPTEAYSVTNSGIDDYAKLVLHFDGEIYNPVVSVSSNSDHYRLHQFDPISALRAKLTITGYDYERQLIIDEETGLYELFKGSYLREIEIYTYTDSGYVNSEDWPIVATDLTDQFDVTNHSLINKDVTDTDTDWDNNETFFKYSDNIFDDPQKVSFTLDGEYITYYQKTDSWVDAGATEYVFGTNVYFDVGTYIVEWAAYASTDLFTADYPEESKISLRLVGPATVDYFADIDVATTWLNESGTITVPEAGRYTVKGVQHIDPTYTWGIRNPNIYRSTGLIKWVSVKRDIAENYSYDDDSGKYGKDYLSTLKVFGDTKYNPTEYNWWWNSTISTLSNDALTVKVGRRSLKIDYPDSSTADTVSFIEGDDFGFDEYFDIKDVLHFWWYISDVSKLDLSFGDVTFGVINSADNAYYKWDVSDMSLSTGWNDMRLKFEDASEFYPSADEFESIFGFVSPKIDFKNNGKDLSSIRLRFRGVGQAFIMNIDDLKIQRNVFEDDVKFDKGMCLIGHDYLEIPLAGMTLERGTIEFWMKPYTDSTGRNLFNDLNSRLLFSMVNNNNNIISLGIKSGAWLQPITGHIRKALSTFEIDVGDLPSNSFISINEIIHIAFVWSHDGSFTDNKDTIRIYINNELIVTSKIAWRVNDTKSAVIKLGGATAQTAHNSDTYGSAIFDNVKIYNYCKTEFNIETEGVEKDISYTANEFLQISENGTDFYGMGSTNLPIVFQAVPAGTSKTIYVRPAKNERFAQSPNTASILVEWLTTV